MAEAQQTKGRGDMAVKVGGMRVAGKDSHHGNNNNNDQSLATKEDNKPTEVQGNNLEEKGELSELQQQELFLANEAQKQEAQKVLYPPTASKDKLRPQQIPRNQMPQGQHIQQRSMNH
eukprot:TRINITY_DN10424_c0_g1_i1.p1 TRINITY_DN10424_c0_g1~~TRINITY_DN10424_c0_g1_i1.p1  ORF type:complete len:118 (+),score=36.90 TRINITY_DN10424_c0_g1_i1:66-419(+)